MAALDERIQRRRVRRDTLQCMDSVVYHGSAIRGLTRIDPQLSTHGTGYVYAMRVPGHCIAFLGGLDDLHIAKEIVDGRLAVVERHPEALDRYGGVTGSVYDLPGDTFLAGQTAWEGEVVSPVPVMVLRERKIEDALQELRSVETSGDLVLYRYPERPAQIPGDDGDLVEKAVIFAHWEGNESSIRQRMHALHPKLADRFERLLGCGDVESLCAKHGIPILRRSQ